MASIKQGYKKQSKQSELLNEYIELFKDELNGSRILKEAAKLLKDSENELNYFRILPYGKELYRAFEIINLRLNKTFNLLQYKSFLSNFYKILLTSIDKKLKPSKDIGLIEIKNAVYNLKNQEELKKILQNFDCKYQNHYYEFSKNGVIELYARSEYLKLRNRISFKQKEKELRAFQLDNNRNKLKSGDPNYELYKRIVHDQIMNELNNKKKSLRQIILNIKNDKEYKSYPKSFDKIYKTFDKWKRENTDNSGYQKLILEVYSDIKSNLKD